MEIIKLKNAKIPVSAVDKIKSVLNAGGVIIYPTETAYAIGGDALNVKTIKKIYEIKKRSGNLPLPVIVSDLEQARKFAYFDSKSLRLSKRYWPGALTLILKKKKNIPALLTARKNSMAMRVSGSNVARAVAKSAGGPIISTSANSSKQAECYSISEIKKQIVNIDNKVDLILDAGRLKRVKPSTIVKIFNGKIQIVRLGEVSI